jgi:hypothetical protein
MFSSSNSYFCLKIFEYPNLETSLSYPNPFPNLEGMFRLLWRFVVINPPYKFSMKSILLTCFVELPDCGLAFSLLGRALDALARFTIG